MRAILVGSGGRALGQEVLLGETTTLGSATGSTLLVESAAPRHAEIRLRGQDLLIAPQDGTVLLNGAALTGSERLRDGDLIALADVAFLVQMHPDDSATMAFMSPDLSTAFNAPRDGAAAPSFSASSERLSPAPRFPMSAAPIEHAAWEGVSAPARGGTVARWVIAGTLLAVLLSGILLLLVLTR